MSPIVARLRLTSLGAALRNRSASFYRGYAGLGSLNITLRLALPGLAALITN